MTQTRSVAYGHFVLCHRKDGTVWEIGRDANGVTYKAENERDGRPVALRVLAAERFAMPGEHEAFVQAATRAAEKLNQESVASILECGQTNGCAFYATEYFAGQTLEEFVNRPDPLTTTLALHLALRIAEGLAAMHSIGLSHLNLHPCNIIVLPKERSLGPNRGAVLDVGVHRWPHIKIYGPDFVQCHHRISADGYRVKPALPMPVGKTECMSPEQLASNAPLIGPASDSYSLGVVLWYLLTKQFPYPAGQIEKKGLPLEQLHSAWIPRTLCARLQWMLSEKPEKRPASGAALLTALAVPSLCRPKPLALNGRDSAGNLQSLHQATSPSQPLRRATHEIKGSTFAQIGSFQPTIEAVPVLLPTLAKSEQETELVSAERSLDNTSKLPPNPSADQASANQSSVPEFGSHFDDIRSPKLLKLSKRMRFGALIAALTALACIIFVAIVVKSTRMTTPLSEHLSGTTQRVAVLPPEHSPDAEDKATHDEEVLLKEARSHKDLKEYQSAIEEYTRLIQDHQNSPNIGLMYLERGMCQVGLKNNESALGDLDKAINLNPENSYAWEYRGWLHSVFKDWDHALEDYTKALTFKLDRRQIDEILDLRSSIYAQQGKRELQIADLSKMIEDDSTKVEYFYARGDAYTMMGQYDKALEDLKTVIRLDDKHTSGLKPQCEYMYLGRAYAGLEQYGPAIENYNVAISIEPRFTYALMKRAEAYVAQNELEAAIKDYTEVMRIDPEHKYEAIDEGAPRGIATCQAKIGQTLCNLKQYDKSIEAFDIAIKLDPGNTYYYDLRAYTYNCWGRKEEAIRDNTNAISINPADEFAHVSRGCKYNDLKRYSQALDDFDQAIKINSHDRLAYSGQAVALRGLGRTADAEKSEQIAKRTNVP